MYWLPCYVLYYYVRVALSDWFIVCTSQKWIWHKVVHTFRLALKCGFCLSFLPQQSFQWWDNYTFSPKNRGTNETDTYQHSTQLSTQPQGLRKFNIYLIIMLLVIRHEVNGGWKGGGPNTRLGIKKHEASTRFYPGHSALEIHVSNTMIICIFWLMGTLWNLPTGDSAQVVVCRLNNIAINKATAY